MKIYRITGIFVIIVLSFSYTRVQAQLGFCNGNSGSPIFIETFGTGITNGPELASGTTTYTYIDGTPNDGQYTVSSFTGYFGWFDIPDHTSGDTNGKSFIVNADFTADEFYKRSVTGLCENTSYEFSSWLLNLTPSNPGCEIPVNVNFQIWDTTDTTMLASGDTGVIASTSSPLWRQYGLVFQTVPGQTSVILKMTNNGNGGCGNDLAIDDIVFKTCGDFITLTDTSDNTAITVCEDETPITLELIATPDFSIYTTHRYQWQQRLNGANWVDIAGETSSTYSAPLITNSVSYRTRVAEDVINLNNPRCSSLSEVFDVVITSKPDPPVTNGDIIDCKNRNPVISVAVPDGISVNWYDASIGGNLLHPGSISYQATSSGTYYAEAISTAPGCVSDQRTAISIDLLEVPEVTDEEVAFCEGDEVLLDATDVNVTYLWSTGETTAQIIVSTAGVYTTEITNSRGCSVIKTIIVIQNINPIIEDITQIKNTIVITTSNMGNFQYSLDGITYQDSNIFSNIKGGLYTIYVRGENNCDPDFSSFLFLKYPDYFTPNGDGFNEFWKIEGIENQPMATIFIYDRYGKLLKQTIASGIGWDGTYLGKRMPSSEYWFLVNFGDGSSKNGHFSLIR